MCACRACCVFMDVCFVLFLLCLYIYACVCLQIQGPLWECCSIRSGFCGLPYYCTPLVCVPAEIGGLAVWRHYKPKTNNQNAGVPLAEAGSPCPKNPFDELRHGQGGVHLFLWLYVMARCVLAISATLAAPDRLFSTAGNVMTKKRSRLTYDNMEELVYLHKVWPQAWEWEAVKKDRKKADSLEEIFFESMKHITFNVFSCRLFFDSETPSESLLV